METRWHDNDAYGHVNNVVYYAWIDTAVNRAMLAAGALDIASSPVVGIVAETGCRYFAPISYPDRIAIGLRVVRLGTSSVRYEAGVFRNDEDAARAEAHYVHVYVDRATMRPTPIPTDARAAMLAMAVMEEALGP